MLPTSLSYIPPMPSIKLSTPIQQLEKRKGGYYYLVVEAETVNLFERKKATRLICSVEDKLKFPCGLNHLGDGNFFIILSTKLFKALGKPLGEQVDFELSEDPNPLGVEVPEVLQVLLEQDAATKAAYDGLTDGKKRSLIHLIKGIKNLDLQIEKIGQFLNGEIKVGRK
jgi:hypothetical protein